MGAEGTGEFYTDYRQQVSFRIGAPLYVQGVIVKKVVIVSGITTVSILALAGLAIFLYIYLQASRPGEATARFIPADSLAYVSVNLRPGTSQIGLAREFFAILEDSEFQDRFDDLLDETEDDTDIHFLDDVSPWLGTDLTVALLDLESDEGGLPAPQWVSLVHVADRELASEFLDDLVDYLEDELDTQFDNDTYRGVDVFVSTDEDIAFGLADEYLVIGDSDDSVEAMVRNLADPPSRPLSENPDFVAAREALPGGRVSFLYINAEDIVDILTDPGGPVDSIILLDDMPKYIAASTSFVDKGLRLDVVYDTPGDSLVLSGENRLRSRDMLPEDTLVLLSTVGIQEMWEETRDSLAEFNPYSGEDVDDLLEAFEDEVGVDIEGDLIESLTGEVALAVLPSDFSLDDYEDVYEGVEGGSVETLLIAEVEDIEQVADALKDFVDYLEDNGVDVDAEGLGPYDAYTVSLYDIDVDYIFRAYQPGYAIIDDADSVILGSTFESLERFQDTVDGDTSPLSASSGFEQLIGLVPQPIHMLLYANIGGISEMVEDSLQEYGREEYRQEVRPFVEPLDKLLVTASVAEEATRLTVILTVKE